MENEEIRIEILKKNKGEGKYQPFYFYLIRKKN